MHSLRQRERETDRYSMTDQQRNIRKMKTGIFAKKQEDKYTKRKTDTEKTQTERKER